MRFFGFNFFSFESFDCIIGGMKRTLAASVDEKALNTAVRSGGVVLRMGRKIWSRIHGGKGEKWKELKWRKHGIDRREKRKGRVLEIAVIWIGKMNGRRLEMRGPRI